MKASVIVPSYNMAGHLAWTLDFLAEQVVASEDAFEVVVVNDGSHDSTQEVAERYLAHIDGKCIFRPRDARSCRSRARNLGLAQARGDLCIFLDSGVIVEPVFVQNALRCHRQQRNAALLHQTLGLYATRFEFERGSLKPANMREKLGHLLEEEAWSDIRDPLFASVDYDLTRLPAPWALGWSCALSVSRQRAAEIGGFDEDFLGWGGEDLDFCYRLGRAGLTFASTGEALCVHIPHATESATSKAAEHTTNKHKLHQRDHDLETEIVMIMGGIAGNLFASRLERLAALQLIPAYGAALLEVLRRHLRGRVLVAGMLKAELLRPLEPALTLVATLRDLALVGRLDGICVERSLCCFTRHSAQEFGSLLLTDALRFYPTEVQVAQLRECARIAQRVFILFTRDEVEGGRKSRYRNSEGWFWSSVEQLTAAAAAAGCELVVVGETHGTALLRLS